MFAALRRPWSWPRPDAHRWVVLDIESSGLDPRRDRLLSVAAVAVQREGARLQMRPSDSFEVVLRQARQWTDDVPADKANILVHGIGVGAQRTGVDPAQALAAFESYAGASPLVGYHAAFDRALLERAQRAYGVAAPRRAWLDLADLAPVVRPGVAGQALDDWLAVFGIHCLARHQAAADALATAELLLCLWPLAQRQAGAGCDFASLQRLANARRWIGP